MRTATAEESLKFEVAQKIRASIYSGEFKPGQPLRELALAKELLVSQAVVREALTHLEPMGLIRRVPNKGTYVTNPSQEEMRDRFRMRILIEEIICLDASKLMTSEEFAEAYLLVDAIDNATSTGDTKAVIDADSSFHRYLWLKSGSPVLNRTIEQVNAPLVAFYTPSSQPQDSKNQRNILAAMESKNEAKNREAVRKHLENDFPTLDK